MSRSSFMLRALNPEKKYISIKRKPIKNVIFFVKNCVVSYKVVNTQRYYVQIIWMMTCEMTTALIGPREGDLYGQLLSFSDLPYYSFSSLFQILYFFLRLPRRRSLVKGGSDFSRHSNLPSACGQARPSHIFFICECVWVPSLCAEEDLTSAAH